MHCPGAAQPIVTFLGVVLGRGGQMNHGQNLLHYRLQTTVYDPSTRTHHTFPITAFFKNGQRWANFPPLKVNAYVFLTGRIFGLTKENRQLAIVADDIHFLPTPTTNLPPTPSPTTGKRKHVDRWSHRAGPTTPSKSNSTCHDEPFLDDSQLSMPTLLGTSIDEHEIARIPCPETTDDANSPPRPTTPTPERRSQRPRKTS